MSETRPRITGTEMEWPVMVKNHREKFFSQATRSQIDAVYDRLDPGIKRVNTMLTNGARLYTDVGEHPEYATPEDTSLWGTVANEIAGENIFYDALSAARDDGIVDDFILNKRVIDDELNTWGYHINLSFLRDERIGLEHNIYPLAPHLATVAIYAGAGNIVRRGHSAVYTTAQKTLNLNTDMSTMSHQADQPLMSLRDESHASGDVLGRAHITSMDANISPWATWMKLGTTSLILKMIETGYWGQKPIDLGHNLFRLAKQVAHDTSVSEPLTLSNGKKIKALDIQGELLMHVQKMSHTEGVTGEEKQVMAEWERALDDLAIDPDKLVDRADWVLKRAALRRFMGRHSLTLADDATIKKERQWSHIGTTGIGVRHRDTLWRRWIKPETIEAAYHNPPRTTRALARSAIIWQLGEDNSDDADDTGLNVTWDKAIYERNGNVWVFGLDDPYEASLPDLSV